MSKPARSKQIHNSSQNITVEERPYQERIIRRGADNWTRGISSQMVVLGTGGGKSYIALRIARQFVLEHAPQAFGVEPGQVGVCWVAMRRNLLAQVVRENRLMAPAGEAVLCPNLHAISEFTKDPMVEMGGYKVVMLIGDEGHHAASQSSVTLAARLKPKAHLFLTATPDRRDKAQICCQVVIRDAGYRSLIRDGYLAQFVHHSIEDEWNADSVSQAYLGRAREWGKSLIFFRTMAECRRARELLAEAGVAAEVVWGGSDRERQLEAFEQGRIPVLISMAILAEGLDVPSLNSVFVRDTDSRSLSQQMCGRVLRRFEGRTKNIVQSVHARYPFTREADAHLVRVQRGERWMDLSASEEVRQIQELVARRIRECQALPSLPDWRKVATSQARLNPFCSRLSIEVAERYAGAADDSEG